MKTVCRLVLAVAVSLSAAADAYGAVTSAGTLSPSGAQLQFTGLASSGGTLVAAGASATGNGGGEIDVFTEPAGGWSSESQAATLTDAAAMHGPFEPSISGGTVVANDAGATGASFDDVEDAFHRRFGEGHEALETVRVQWLRLHAESPFSPMLGGAHAGQRRPRPVTTPA